MPTLANLHGCACRDDKLSLLPNLKPRVATVLQDERPFVSAKKVMMDMGEPYASALELVCFHTVSKGTLGECGMRGG